MNIADLLRSPAATRPDHAALVSEGRVYTYAELDRLTDRFAGFLRTGGIEAGQVIGVLLESGSELVIAALGAFKAGVVPNVVNAMLGPEEVRTVIADSGAVLLITDAEREVALRAVSAGLGVRRTLLVGPPLDSVLRDVSKTFATLNLPPATVACLLYTSGTTGKPKGVMLTHRNITDNATQFARVHFGPDDRLLVAAPLFHCWGLINGVLGAFAAGATAIVVRRFKAEPVLDLMEALRPTQFLGVPAMVNHLTLSPTRAGRDLSSLRVVHSAAAPMRAELIAALRDDWEIGYAESYGLTEVSPVITTTSPADMRPGS